MSGPWTSEEDKALKDGRAAGYSFGQISGLIGRARNACIGRAARLGMERMAPAKPGPKPKPQTGPKPKLSSGAKRFNPSFTQDRVAKTPPELMPDATLKGWPKPMTATAVDIMGLTSETCRMPLFGHDEPFASQFYCGAAPKPGSVYCPACRQITVDPNYVRRRKVA